MTFKLPEPFVKTSAFSVRDQVVGYFTAEQLREVRRQAIVDCHKAVSVALLGADLELSRRCEKAIRALNNSQEVKL